LEKISEIASYLGIPNELVHPYGNYKAKIGLQALLGKKAEGNQRSKLVLVTSMTPTPFGEGKTVIAIGLASALHRLGLRSVVCIRQPSLGPLFGIKGGAAGGGKSTVEPMNEINMRFTGDIDAVASAHNLLSAVVDNHIFHGNELEIDPKSITWRRTVDMNDRALRHIVVGLDQRSKNGAPLSRDDAFVITAASEAMAILCLAQTYRDLKERLGKMIVGFNRSGLPVRAGDLGVSGAMAAVLKNAMEPNLVQSSDGSPALVHGGPFGNIATGTSSLVSIQMGLAYADYCVVEAGFGSDLGAEKFFDIVARVGGFRVDAAVIVVSIRALKYHSQSSEKSYNANVRREEKSQLQSSLPGSPLNGGIQNLEKHVENVKSFGLAPVVALNRFASDTDAEVNLVREACLYMGVQFEVSNVFSQGAQGGLALAQLVAEAAQTNSHSNLRIYESDDSFEEKVEKVVKKIYGGSGFAYTPAALQDLDRIQKLGFEKLPICMAKTPLSLSDDPKVVGRPDAFSVQLHHIGISAGAGFVIPYMGEIMTMPGLPKHPVAERIDITDSGEITGLF